MKKISILSLFAVLLYACGTKSETTEEQIDEVSSKINIIFDTDANNELDDQHALAYLLLNGNTFNVNGVTVNNTRNGDGIQGQYDEAMRVLQLCNLQDEIPLLLGAEDNFDQISKDMNPESFDGKEAVDFMIEQTKIFPNTIIVAVGKLTNVALALKKDPSMAERTKVIWLGSNYPEPREYNLVNDTTSLNYVLDSSIPLEMVVCRYGKPSGTDAVRASPDDIKAKLIGKGPKANTPIIGRNGGEFSTFGDYSLNLFSNIDLHGDPPSRALFDMVAVAILKNQTWGETFEVPAPVYFDEKWVERPSNSRKITVWENFNKEAVMKDFYDTFDNYTLAKTP